MAETRSQPSALHFQHTSNLGPVIVLGAGISICPIACFFKNSNACFSMTFASLDNILIADWPLQNPLGL